MHGVTAYLGRPVQRERPNERFLSHTIRSVQHGEWVGLLERAAGRAGSSPRAAPLLLAANKRAEEGELWARYEMERERAKGRNRSRSPRRRRASPAEGSGRGSEREGSQGEASPPPGDAGAASGYGGGLDDEHVARMLASKRTRWVGGWLGRCHDLEPAGRPEKLQVESESAAADGAQGAGVHRRSHGRGRSLHGSPRGRRRAAE